ncbi:MAG: hypothetical protein ACOCVR_00500 [Myxococcota bacterium]
MMKPSLSTIAACLTISAILLSAGCGKRREQSLRTIYMEDAPSAEEEHSSEEGDSPSLVDRHSLARLSFEPAGESRRLDESYVPGLRVVVSASGITVDDEEMVSFLEARLPERDTSEPLAPLPPEARTYRIDWPAEVSEHRVPDLVEALGQRRDALLPYVGSENLAPAVAISGEERRALKRVLLLVPRELPYERLVAVLYSLGQSSLGKLDLAVEAGGEVYLLPLRLPHTCSGTSTDADPCTLLSFVSLPAGLHVTVDIATEGEDGLPNTVSLLLDHEELPSWSGSQLLGEGGSCPAIPADSAGIDPASVARVLRAAGTLGRPCRTSTLMTARGRSWQQVAEAVAALVHNEQKVHMFMMMSDHASNEAFLECEGALDPAKTAP